MPYFPTVPAYAQVMAEVYNKMNSLKLAGTSVFVAISDNVGQEVRTVQLEASMVSANDTTLQASFVGWEAILFTAGSEAGKLLDTEVATFIQGHA